MRRHTAASLVSTILSLLWLAATFTLTGAHGYGKPQILNEPSGPYLLSIWTDPDPLRADETHVVVAVIDPATQELIVSDVTVTVRMQSLEDPAIEFVQIAGPDNTNRLLFAAEFNDKVSDGNWRVGVSAAGAAGQGEEVSFAVAIQPARGMNWLWVGAGGLLLLIVLWLWSASRPKSVRVPASSHHSRDVA
jgi:hypothetical protein